MRSARYDALKFLLYFPMIQWSLPLQCAPPAEDSYHTIPQANHVTTQEEHPFGKRCLPATVE